MRAKAGRAQVADAPRDEVAWQNCEGAMGTSPSTTSLPLHVGEQAVAAVKDQGKIRQGATASARIAAAATA